MSPEASRIRRQAWAGEQLDQSASPRSRSAGALPASTMAENSALVAGRPGEPRATAIEEGEAMGEAVAGGAGLCEGRLRTSGLPALSC